MLSMLCLLHSITNKEQNKKHLCNQSSHYRKIVNTVTGKPHHAVANQHFALSAKRTRTQRQVHDACIVCIACGWHTFWDEAISNSEMIKPVALSIVELCLARGIS